MPPKSPTKRSMKKAPPKKAQLKPTVSAKKASKQAKKVAKAAAKKPAPAPAAAPAAPAAEVRRGGAAVVDGAARNIRRPPAAHIQRAPRQALGLCLPQTHLRQPQLCSQLSGRPLIALFRCSAGPRRRGGARARQDAPQRRQGQDAQGQRQEVGQRQEARQCQEARQRQQEARQCDQEGAGRAWAAATAAPLACALPVPRLPPPHLACSLSPPSMPRAQPAAAAAPAVKKTTATKQAAKGNKKKTSAKKGSGKKAVRAHTHAGRAGPAHRWLAGWLAGEGGAAGCRGGAAASRLRPAPHRRQNHLSACLPARLLPAARSPRWPSPARLLQTAAAAPAAAAPTPGGGAGLVGGIIGACSAALGALKRRLSVVQ